MSRSFDFSDETKARIAGRAGYICTYPDCGLLTIGPHPDDPSKYQLLGQAAHIRSGAPNGPRSAHGKLTDVQLAAVSNGLWLCAKHHYMIDLKSKGLEQRYTAALLVSWRLAHEASIELRTQSQDPRGFFSITEVRVFDSFNHDRAKVELPSLLLQVGRTTAVVAADHHEAEHHLDAVLGPSQWKNGPEGRPRLPVDIALRIPELRTITSRGSAPNTYSPAQVIRPRINDVKEAGHLASGLVDRAGYRPLGGLDALLNDVTALSWCDVDLVPQSGDEDHDYLETYMRFTRQGEQEHQAHPLSRLTQREAALLSVALAFTRARHLAKETPTILGIDSALLGLLTTDAYEGLIADLEKEEAKLQTIISCIPGSHTPPPGWQEIRLPHETRTTDHDYASLTLP